MHLRTYILQLRVATGKAKREQIVAPVRKWLENEVCEYLNTGGIRGAEGLCCMFRAMAIRRFICSVVFLSCFILLVH